MSDFASKTAKASIKAGQMAPKEVEILPDPELVRLLRIDREAHLWPGVQKIDALLREYDIEKTSVLHLGSAYAALLTRAETAEEEVRSLAKLNGQLLAQVQELEQVADASQSSDAAYDEEETLNADGEADRQEESLAKPEIGEEE